MRHINIFNRIRTALSLTLLIFLIVAGLLFILPAQALAQETNSNDKIEAIAKKLEELEKQIKELKRENSELKMRLDGRETPKVVLATENRTPVEQTREVIVAQQEPEPQDKEKRLEFGGEIRLRPELRDNNLNNFTRDVKFLVLQRARLHAKAKLNDDISGFVQIQDTRVWGEEFSTTTDFFNVDLHQAYIDVNHFLTKSLSLRAGRQELSYGNERLIGVFDWNNDARAFDAVKAVYARKGWSADFFAARIKDDEFSRYQDFYGTYLKFFNDNPNGKLEFYGLVLKDSIGLRGEGGRDIIDATTIYTVGTRQEAKSDSGFYYDGEIAVQTGHRGPDDHRALALAAKVGKYFESARSTHFGFEYDFATGDGNSGDRKSHEFIDLFPNNHIHYGYIDFLGWRNMHDFRINFGFNPINKLAFDADYHMFLLHREGGRWSNADGNTLGFNPFGTFGRSIGQELDLTFGFPYKERINLLTGYSVFFPGRFAKATRGSGLSHFSYIQALLVF